MDNDGQKDYLLFEFDHEVAVDSAYLGYVVNDSDMTVWIGTVDGAFDNHIALTDSVLSSMGFTEINTTTLSSSRLADLNASEFAGNVLIVAARTDQSNDYFKLQHLTVQATTPVCEDGG